MKPNEDEGASFNKKLISYDSRWHKPLRLATATKGHKHVTAYIREAIREKLIKEGYMDSLEESIL
jgi:hypothetical protein